MSVIPSQLIRFGIVGVLSNLALYAVYLALTRWGADPKVAMSIAYATGTVQAFALNRSWTFGYRGAMAGPFARYVAAYATGYLANLIILVALVNGAGLHHAAVQAGAVLAVAALLFLLQKHWVFRGRPAQPGVAARSLPQQPWRPRPDSQ
jgi:putative flippase GtrA